MRRSSAAQISAARIDALELAEKSAQRLEDERRLAAATLSGESPPSGSRLGSSLADLVAAAAVYEQAARREADLREA